MNGILAFGMPGLLAFGFGPMEMAIVGGIVLLLFGGRLPGAMRNLGRSVVEFKKGVKDIEDHAEGETKSAEKVAEE